MASERLGGLGGRQLGRRRLLAGVGAGGLGLTALAGACNTSRTPASSAGGKSTAAIPAAKQPKRGGTLNYAGGLAGSFDTQGRSFDPHIQTQGGSKGYTLFYERLLGYNLITYEVEPDLAQKWEQPSPTEYVFHPSA